MAAKKTAGTTKSSGKSRSAAGNAKGRGSTSKTVKKTSTANHTGKKKTGRRTVEDVNEYKDRMAFETGITLFILLIIAVFLYFSFFGLCGLAGTILGGFVFGFFGWIGWLLPLSALAGYVFYIVNRDNRLVPRKIISCYGVLLALAGLTDLVSDKEIITEYYEINHVLHHGYLECMNLTLHDVMTHSKANGGLLGRWLSTLFSSVLGRVGAGVILAALLLLFVYLFMGMELMGTLRRRNSYREEMEDAYQEMGDGEYREPSYRVHLRERRKKSISADGADTKEVTAKAKPVPEVVPSVDLQKMNERLDQIERQMAAVAAPEAVHEEKPPLSPDISREARQKLKEKMERQREGRQANKAEEQAFTGGADREAAGTKSSTRGVERETAADSKVQGNRDRLVEAVPTEAVRGRDVSEAEVVRAEESALNVPIYREEMNQKFGRSRAEKARRQSFEERFSEVAITPGANSTSTDGLAADGHRMPLPSAVAVSEEMQEEPLEVQPSKGSLSLSQDTALQEEEPSPLQEEEPSPLQGEPLPEELPSLSQEAVLQEEPLSQEIEPQGMDAHETPLLPSQDTQPKKTLSQEAQSQKAQVQDAVLPSQQKPRVVRLPYEFPPIDLLTVPEETESGVSDTELRMTAAKLQSTLKSFNVNVQMGPVTCGPTVTRYELQPEQGVRVNKITNLADDLKLSLAAASIRIEAPIPGKSAVGIEVPNPSPSAVYFRELLDGEAFQKAKSPVTFAVGKDIAGKIIMTDIAKMPHLLIAGATGSGKSVCINTLIMSILYKADPEDVKLIMIDPKVVELSVYNGIPHLFCPVVTDPKEAAAALNWAVREMMERYEKFKELGVRNIAGYNEKVKKQQAEGCAKMPLLVIIVDEFADLMMVASKEVEDAVCRLAQLARAAGIHLVLATQRPSVNVITGVIKANIPSRIAFSVSSAIDSRTILDKGGAEKLLGKGDMLFFPSGYSEPVRVQGAFVSDREVSDVVEFLCSRNAEPEYNHAVTEMTEPEQPPKEKESTKPEYDEYFEPAGYFVIESERAAAGQLQRKFSIGFNRAGRIIDQLHKAGVVGPAEGTKPRKILMTREEFAQLLGGDGGTVSNEVAAVAEIAEDTLLSDGGF